MPTPKKASRGDVIKTLLPASDVPDAYIDLFDTLVKGEDGVGGKISLHGVTKVLSAGKLGADEQSRIISILTAGGKLQDLSRNEFNVLLALIGLAQEHEEVNLDAVDERRKSQYHISSPSRRVYTNQTSRPTKTKSPPSNISLPSRRF